jgi:hypothetical protein
MGPVFGLEPTYGFNDLLQAHRAGRFRQLIAVLAVDVAFLEANEQMPFSEVCPLSLEGRKYLGNPGLVGSGRVMHL